MSRVAVVLMNLGGPDSLDAVGPFLRNLFRDPAIIGAPGPVRWFLARNGSPSGAGRKRGRSTARSAGVRRCLRKPRRRRRLCRRPSPISVRSRSPLRMRYWHPMSEASRAAGSCPSGRIGSCCCRSIRSSRPRPRRPRSPRGVTPPTQPASPHRRAPICCHPRADGLIAAHAALIEPLLAKRQPGPGLPRLLFSAHGLPEARGRARRSLPVASRSDCAAHRGPPRLRGPGLGRSATKARSGRSPGWSPPPSTSSTAPGGMACPWSSCPSPSSPSTARPWWSSTSPTASMRSERVSPRITGCLRSARIRPSSRLSRGWCAGALDGEADSRLW